MRRLLTWYLPLTAGIVLSLVFLWGFIKGLRGNAGEPVRESTVARRTEAEAKPDGATEEALIVVLGDSLARGTGDEIGEGIGGRLGSILEERDVEHEIANLAVNGARTRDLLGQIERDSVQRLLGDASVVLISIGGNDFFGERDSFGVSERTPEKADEVIEEIQERIETIVSKIRGVNQDSMIFLLGLYNPFGAEEAGEELSPLVARWNARLVQRLSEDTKLVVVQTSDLFLANDRLSPDRFHPNGEAYGLIARRIADAL